MVLCFSWKDMDGHRTQALFGSDSRLISRNSEHWLKSVFKVYQLANSESSCQR